MPIASVIAWTQPWHFLTNSAILYKKEEPMDEVEPRRRGRPLKQASPGESVSLGVRVSGALKAQLDAAARQNGRTQSSELVHRLESTFRDQGLADQVLDLAYGPIVAAIVELVASAMIEAGKVAALQSVLDLPPADALGQIANWPMISWSMHQAVDAGEQVLAAFRPLESPTAPLPALRTNDERLNAVLAIAREQIGRGLARGKLEHVVHPDRIGGEQHVIAERLHHKVAPFLQRIEARLHGATAVTKEAQRPTEAASGVVPPRAAGDSQPEPPTAPAKRRPRRKQP
jgi:hypothetical protein